MSLYLYQVTSLDLDSMKISKLLWQAYFLLLPLTGGILMGLTPAPVEAWPLAWVALIPLWFLVARGETVRQCALYGLAWGIGYHGLALFWITGIHPMTWMGVPWLASLAIAIFCWMFITLWGAVLVAIWAASLFWLLPSPSLQRRVGRVGFGINQSQLIPWLRVLVGTALWCGLEALWSGGSLWWTSLSYTQSPHNLPILHLGQLSGPSTVVALVVAVNGLIAEAWISYQQVRAQGSRVLVRRDAKNRSFSEEGRKAEIFYQSLDNPLTPSPPHPLAPSPPRPLIYLGTAVGLLVASHLIGFGLYSRPLIQPTAAALKVGIIQGNIPNEIKLFSEGGRRALSGYTSGYQTLADQGVDAVLTPEGALPFFQSDLMNSSFVSAVQEKGVVAWLGAFGGQGRNFTNSLFTLTGRGEIFSRYNKVNLVPIGEYVPFEQVLGGLIKRLSPLDEHQVPGSPTQVFDTPFGRAIAGICYDSAFAEHFRRQAASGGQFLLSASNNAHYSASMPAQHHAQDVMRAIETDRWAVRATNTGYSGIVDPHGRTIWLSRLKTYAIHADTIYRRQTKTLYVRWGNWLTPVLLGCAGLSWFVYNRTGRSKSLP